MGNLSNVTLTSLSAGDYWTANYWAPTSIGQPYFPGPYNSGTTTTVSVRVEVLLGWAYVPPEVKVELVTKKLEGEVYLPFELTVKIKDIDTLITVTEIDDIGVHGYYMDFQTVTVPVTTPSWPGSWTTITGSTTIAGSPLITGTTTSVPGNVTYTATP